jgi:hypothetical protein
MDTYGLTVEMQTQVAAVCCFITTLLALRIFGVAAGRTALKSKPHTLDMSRLNDCVLFKEVFLAYLNAALLEPVLAIAGMEHAEGPQLWINVLTVGAIFWWIFLVTDAFDFADVAQQFRYHSFRKEVEQDAKKYEWLTLPGKKDAAEERAGLVGSVGRDVALWFCLLAILMAFVPGVVTHRDVLHAYAIVFLWAIMHHRCRQATVWGGNYVVTFMLPSSALMPLEYCLPLQETGDCIEDLEVRRFGLCQHRFWLWKVTRVVKVAGGSHI